MIGNMDNSVELEQVDALQELEDASTIIEQEEGTGVNDEIDDEAIALLRSLRAKQCFRDLEG